MRGEPGRVARVRPVVEGAPPRPPRFGHTLPPYDLVGRYLVAGVEGFRPLLSVTVY